jgi:hypothetical protein
MVDTGPPGRASKKVPPLAYIIIALVVILVAIAVFGPNRTLTTPSGSTVDAQVPENSAMTTTAGGTVTTGASEVKP